ncbi:MAG: hypothetical protein KJN71_03000 [Acidimicrobiia bacterium]|nr:hypothetical protein [Acidimicrobiia bacterium]
MRRLTLLAVMMLLVASSSPSFGAASEIGVIANALEPTRTSIPRIATSEPSIIRDSSTSSTGAIPMTATIGTPSRRTLPPLRSAPIRPPVDPKEPTETVESVEQRTYSADVGAAVADVQVGLNALFSLQGLDSTAQISLSPGTGTAVMLFVEQDEEVVAVVSLSARDDGSTIAATWTDR